MKKKWQRTPLVKGTFDQKDYQSIRCWVLCAVLIMFSIVFILVFFL
jgi:hypothetical protein